MPNIKNMQTYQGKDVPYFNHTRFDILPALPTACGRVLEIGCGAGATLAWLRKRPGTTHTTGVEIFPDAAQRAVEHLDEVHCLDFERQSAPDHWVPFDTILCLDVLEHMVDPWCVLNRLVTYHLRPGGILIVTLPNVRHHTVVLPLLLRGRWEYQEAGIMDRTHLRFFSRASALALMRHPALNAPHCSPIGFEKNTLKRVLNRLTLRCFEEWITPQYLLSARKKTTGSS